MGAAIDPNFFAIRGCHGVLGFVLARFPFSFDVVVKVFKLSEHKRFHWLVWVGDFDGRFAKLDHSFIGGGLGYDQLGGLTVDLVVLGLFVVEFDFRIARFVDSPS